MKERNKKADRVSPNFYLRTAISVLKIRRRPLSASAIIEDAYRMNLMPHHLHGKTQEKTLQARISRDILEKRDGSDFYRTAPGRFFLKEFLDDINIPEEYKKVYIAKRRKKYLNRYSMFSFDKSVFDRLISGGFRAKNKYILKNISINQKEDSINFRIKIFCLLKRGKRVLSFTVGHMKSYDDYLYDKKSIGFFSYLNNSSKDLFSADGCGIIECGIQTVNEDLGDSLKLSAKLSHFKLAKGLDGILELVAVVYCRLKEDINSFNSNLSVRRVEWLDLSQCTDYKFFEPLSKNIIEEMGFKK